MQGKAELCETWWENGIEEELWSGWNQVVKQTKKHQSRRLEGSQTWFLKRDEWEVRQDFDEQ